MPRPVGRGVGFAQRRVSTGHSWGRGDQAGARSNVGRYERTAGSAGRSTSASQAAWSCLSRFVCRLHPAFSAGEIVPCDARLFQGIGSRADTRRCALQIKSNQEVLSLVVDHGEHPLLRPVFLLSCRVQWVSPFTQLPRLHAAASASALVPAPPAPPARPVAIHHRRHHVLPAFCRQLCAKRPASCGRRLRLPHFNTPSKPSQREPPSPPRPPQSIPPQ
jgi:hypothetical protein